MISVVIFGNRILGFNDSKFIFSIFLLPIPQLFFQPFTLLFEWIFFVGVHVPCTCPATGRAKISVRTHQLSILHKFFKQTGAGMRLEMRSLNIPLLLPFPWQTYLTRLCLNHNLFDQDLTSKLPGYLIIFLPLSHPK